MEVRLVTAHSVHVEDGDPSPGPSSGRRAPLDSASGTSACHRHSSLEPLCRGLATTIGRRHGGRDGKPFFIELAGTPRAGKTTALNDLARMLRRSGLRVETVEESAGECPVPHKRHPDFNRWTFYTTLGHIIGARHTDTDVVLIDRGIVDAVCWMDWYLVTGGVSITEYHTIERVALLPCWEDLMNLVLVMTTEPPVAIQRDSGDRSAGSGRIVNPDTLGEFNLAVERVHRRFNGRLPLVRLDTTRLSPAEVLRRLMEASLGAAAAARR